MEAEVARTADLSGQIDDVANQLSALNDAVVTANGAVVGGTTNAATLQAQLDTARTKLDKLQSQLKTAQARLTALNQAAARQAAINAAARARPPPPAQQGAKVATERILPPVALPAPARPRHLREGVARPMARPARPMVMQREAVLNTPTRAGMLIGASAAIYAVTLAGVSVMQADSDAATAARRQPYLEAVASARSANDALEAALAKADSGAQALASQYATVGQDIAALPGPARRARQARRRGPGHGGGPADQDQPPHRIRAERRQRRAAAGRRPPRTTTKASGG